MPPLLWMLLFFLVILPIALGIVFVILPHFFIVWRHVFAFIFGLRASIKKPQETVMVEESLLGKEGVTHSQLRPSGVAMISGRRYDVVTRGELLEKGTNVRVLEVTGNRIVVQEL